MICLQGLKFDCDIDPKDLYNPLLVYTKTGQTSVTWELVPPWTFLLDAVLLTPQRAPLPPPSSTCSLLLLLPHNLTFPPFLPSLLPSCSVLFVVPSVIVLVRLLL